MPRVLGDNEPLLWVHGVDHTFGSGPSANQVLFNIDLEVLPGELVILAGISGCGKTTLLTLIGGLRTLQKKDIGIWNDRRGAYDTLFGMTEKDLVRLRQRIGFIFQRHNLFDSLSAAQNVRMSQELHDDDTDRYARLAAAVRALGLDPAQRSQPLPEGVTDAALDAVLALGGKVQPAALVLPLDADGGLEALLERHGWRLDPARLPLPRPLDPAVLGRLRKRGFAFPGDGTLTLPTDPQESDWLALHDLGLRFGGRRLPLLGEPGLDDLLQAGATREGTRLLLPAPPERRVEELLAEVGLRSTEHSLHLPPGPLAEPVFNLLEQLRLPFHQGALALPPGTEDDLVPRLLALRFLPDGSRLRIDPRGGIFAIRLLQQIGVPVERTVDDDGVPTYAVPLRNPPPGAVEGLVALWPRLTSRSRARDLVHAKPAKLSGGQRQRVAISRALINDPLLILADEPTAALDPERKLQVIQLLKARALLHGTTSLVVTHDENIMRRADRIVTMVQGRIASNVVVAEEAFVYEALRKSPLFAALPTEAQLALTAELLLGVHPEQEVGAAVRKRCPWFEEHAPGTDIVREGDPGGRAYLIRRGVVRVLRGGEEVVTLKAGDIFGDQAILALKPRNATVRAADDGPVETYSITEKRFAVYRAQALPLINRVLGVYGPPGTPLVEPFDVDDGAADGTDDGTNAGGNRPAGGP